MNQHLYNVMFGGDSLRFSQQGGVGQSWRN